MSLPAILLGMLLAVSPPTTPGKNGPCPPEGDATRPQTRELNERRARNETPSDDDLDETVTMESLLEPGDDTLRWQGGTAVEIVAYVVEIRDGGPTSANCHSANADEHDTVLELSSDADMFDRPHRVFAAVTPARRRLMVRNGEDWSTRGLRALYLHRYVSVSGWLLFDFEAAGKAVNTSGAPGPGITRATAWEIHPATGIALAEEGGAEQASLESRAPTRRPEERSDEGPGSARARISER